MHRLAVSVLLASACSGGLAITAPEDQAVAPTADAASIPLDLLDNASFPDLSTPDLSTPDLITPDLITPDLITPDLITPDLSTGPTADLAFRRPPDLMQVPAPACNGTLVLSELPAAAAGGSVDSTTFGDFDGDGRLDVACSLVNPGYATSVVLGNGDGTFLGPTSFPYWGVSLAAGDFDGDGDSDLAIDGTSSLTVLLYNGRTAAPTVRSTNFGFGTPFPLTGNFNPVTGDFNHDRKVDLATQAAAGFNVLLSNGDGTFQPPVTYGAGGGKSVLPSFVGDFNGDGNPDLIATLFAPSLPPPQPPVGYPIAVVGFAGTASGAFVGPVTLFSGGATPDAIGDFNGDLKLDIAVDDGHGHLVILLGTGDGTFQSPLSSSNRSGPAVAADFDRDGKLDLAVSSNRVHILRGKGDGTFAALPTDYPIPNLVTLSGDFNGDGVPDLASRLQLSDAVALFLGKGDGTFFAMQDYPLAPNPIAIVNQDFNGDGKPDLAASLHGGGVNVVLGNGDGSFGSFATYATVHVPMALRLTADDFTGDGVPDLMVDTGGQMELLVNHGDGTFGASSMVAGTARAHNWSRADDLDGDGKPDLVLLTATSVDVLLGNGDGTFRAALETAAAGYQSMASGDFNGDGRLDLVLVDDGGGVILLGNGDGTLATGLPFSGTSGLVLHPGETVITGDFNGDRKLDVVIPKLSPLTPTYQVPSVDILFGNGDGTLGLLINQVPLFDLDPMFVAAGDLNGDGRSDLLLGQYDSLRLLVGNSDGTFGAPADYFVVSGPAATLGDFDGNGRIDVAIAESKYGSLGVGVLLNFGCLH
jgi:hypothetical protein